MKISKKIYIVITVVLIGISIAGVFEERALNFVSDVYKRNLSFLALTTELKLIFVSLSSSRIPFVDGISTEVGQTIGKVQEYLLVTDIISFLQIMLISISKSYLLKIVSVVLFILSFFKSSKVLCSKILILTLALNPGLILYSVVVQEISQEASIDFGDKYLKKLKNSVTAIKLEKTELIKEHTRDITRINNGEKGLRVLNKFREDIAYDFNREKLDIEGDYVAIRLLIHEGSHEIMSKIFGFCSMVLFTMVLLPLGYGLLIYILFNSLFNNDLSKLSIIAEQSLASKPIKGDVLPLRKKVFDFFKQIRQKKDLSMAKLTPIHIDATVKEGVPGEIDHLKSHITDELAKLRGDLLYNLKTHITNEVSQIKVELSGKVESSKKEAESTVATSVKKEETIVEKKKDGNELPNELSI